ncbi:LSU ribosomal protein L24p (L26e) [hydrothermal vent metagenome]|uniref:LSU ribosomal protein L24p (L26e) n=1 Tax=hydrothermal vent metagenome TaxID=652676 RepID=A0A3B1D2X5_9ZZZZ
MALGARNKMKIKKDDVVVVIAGADKGKKGRVIEAIPGEGRVIVEKVNIVKRHQRPTPQQRQGGIIEREAKFAASNVAIFCSKCDKAVRIGAKILEDGTKVRVCRKCGEMLDD